MSTPDNTNETDLKKDVHDKPSFLSESANVTQENTVDPECNHEDDNRSSNDDMEESVVSPMDEDNLNDNEGEEGDEESNEETEHDSVIATEVLVENEDQHNDETKAPYRLMEKPYFDPFPKTKAEAAYLIIKYYQLYPAALDGTEFSRMPMEAKVLCKKYLLRHLKGFYQSLKIYVYDFAVAHNANIESTTPSKSTPPSNPSSATTSSPSTSKPSTMKQSATSTPNPKAPTKPQYTNTEKRQMLTARKNHEKGKGKKRKGTTTNNHQKKRSKPTEVPVVNDEDDDDTTTENENESSESDDSSLNRVRKTETDNEKTCILFRNCYRYFKNNKPNKVGGFGKFPLHLLSYLFHRSISGLKGRYNPTAKCTTDLGEFINVSSGNPLHHFCRKVMNVNEEEYENVLRKGSTLAFKRAMKPYKIMGGTKQPCDDYLRLKKSLKITGW